MSQATSDLWEKIVVSPFAHVYIQELRDIASAVVEACDEIFAGFPEPPPGSGYILVDRKRIATIRHLLTDVARIRSLLTAGLKRPEQTDEEHVVKRGRAEWLRKEVLGDLRLREVHKTYVRNTLEHFDEYLDQTAIGSCKGTIRRPTIVPIDMALSDMHTLDVFLLGGERPTVYPLRVFYVKERIFLNAGMKINLGLISSECAEIVERLQPLLHEAEVKSPDGSRMLVITDRSFG